MKVLVIGQGGREHAIIRALKTSPSVHEIHCAPGNDGIALEALCHPIDVNDIAGTLGLCQAENFDLVVIGPEGPLAAGLADEIRRLGVAVFGPNANGARLEASKIFSKQFMEKAGVPTARYEIVSSLSETMTAAEKFTTPYVLKANGLAAGKGVFICDDLAELETAARSLFVEKILGQAGQSALLEEYQPGWELSYLLLTNGKDYISMPLAQDHKRLKEGDMGPNTGGMGVVAPLTIDPHLEEQIQTTILKPSVAQLERMGLLYRGVLYCGIMVTKDGPSVLEYNVRFGDPEAQALMPLLNGDWGELMMAVAAGEMPEAKWKSQYLACLVLAAEGYPESPQKGVPIVGEIAAQTPQSYFLHAGTKRDDQGHWLTNGGRVLNSVGLGVSLPEALKAAYAQAKKVRWPGMQLRSDIGQKMVESNSSN